MADMNKDILVRAAFQDAGLSAGLEKINRELSDMKPGSGLNEIQARFDKAQEEVDQLIQSLNKEAEAHDLAAQSAQGQSGSLGSLSGAAGAATVSVGNMNAAIQSQYASIGRAIQAAQAQGRTIDTVYGSGATVIGAHTAAVQSNTASMLKSVAAFAGVTIGVQQIVGSFKESINLSLTHEKSMRSLTFALRGYGASAEGVARDVDDWAEAQQRATAISSDTIVQGVALAVSYGATAEKAKELTTAALDYAAATGRSEQEAIRQVVKTLGGYAGELGETIPALKQLTDEQLKAGGAAGVIAKQFGGAAEALRDSYGGSLENLRQELRDTKQAFGDLLTAGAPPGEDAFSKSLQHIQERLKDLKRGLDETGTGFDKLLLNSLILPELEVGGAIRTGRNLREMEREALPVGTAEDPAAREARESVEQANRELAEQALLTAKANEEATTQAKEFERQMIELNRVIPEAVIAMNRVADVRPEIPPPTQYNPFDVSPGDQRIKFATPPPDYSKFVDQFPPIPGGLPGDDIMSPSDALGALTDGFFDSLMSGFGRATGAADDFFEYLVKQFGQVLTQTIGDLFSDAIRSAIPIPFLSAGARGSTGAGSGVRYEVRANLNRELRTAARRGY